MLKLPILNYHGFESTPDEYPWAEDEIPYVLKIYQLSAQLDYLKENQFSTLKLDELGRWLKGSDQAKKPIIVTFDDGLLSHFDYAVDNLRTRRFSGIFFVSTAMVGKKGYMDWPHLRQMTDEGFEIGSHGLNHIPLSSLNETDLLEEVEVSKQMIEQAIAKEVRAFSVPRGFYHHRIQKAVRKAGYQYLFTSHFDINHVGQNPLGLNRMVIKANTNFEEFKRFVRSELGMKRYLEKTKSLIRESVPPALYMRLAKMKQKFTSM